jgi:hypothetical protein
MCRHINLCHNCEGGGSSGKGEGDKDNLETASSYTDAHTAYKTVASFFYVHSTGEHEEQHTSGSELLAATCSHPDLSGPVTKLRNNWIKSSDHEKLKSWRTRLHCAYCNMPYADYTNDTCALFTLLDWWVFVILPAAFLQDNPSFFHSR